VDEDLDYTGTDEALVRAFTAGYCQQGWRVLLVGHDTKESFQQVVETALGVLGFDGRDPALPGTSGDIQQKLLATFGVDLTQLVKESGGSLTIGREEQVEAAVSCLLQWQVSMPILVGESGVGKTNLLQAVARKLGQCRPEHRVVSVDLGALMAGTLFDSERENLLSALLNELNQTPRTVLALEHLELALKSVPRGALLISRALDAGARLIGTTLPRFASAFEAPPLARRAQLVELAEMTADRTFEVLTALRDVIAGHHRVQIPEPLLHLAIETAETLTGHFPAKAITLVDAAAARAVLTGESEVSPFDLHLAADRLVGSDE
jgi:ATP-dependent Clp protease ATP-binding subunit ClpA